MNLNNLFPATANRVFLHGEMEKTAFEDTIDSFRAKFERMTDEGDQEVSQHETTG